MMSRSEGWLPINGSPVGLVTWYGPDGPVAVLASWLAVIDGQPPELRGGCPGQVPGRNGQPGGFDFAVNIPANPMLPALTELIAKAAACSPVPIDADADFSPARSVHAPLLRGCALQIECVHGRNVPGGWATEFAGEIMLLHRGGIFLDPADHADFCALRPLRTALPS
ncbi:MAG: hypothetical protein NDI73_01590 [Desulfuromonadales bacterium]|nr:hypothetical protein [Desulfuromonadales bacterium]